MSWPWTGKGLWLLVSCGLLSLCLTISCDQTDRPSRTAGTTAGGLADKLVLYDWVDDMPRSVLDDFTREFGVRIDYVTFESQEEAVEALQQGKVCDVAVVENPFVPELIKAQKLTRIDFDQIPNFKNISVNFRDMTIDPGNRYTVPYHYGTTGLLVRTDLVGDQVSSWRDLWDPRFAGRVAMRLQKRELLGISLLSLGHSLNSERPEEVEAAMDRLITLKDAALWVEVASSKAVAKLLRGEAVILLGWPMDFQMAHAANPAVAYILPREGTVLWSDNYVIPASSGNPHTAAVFINFLLRPEVSAKIANEKNYPTANEAALPLIHPEVRNDPAIFPSAEVLRQAHYFQPIDMAEGSVFARAWARFFVAPQPKGSNQ